MPGCASYNQAFFSHTCSSPPRCAPSLHAAFMPLSAARIAERTLSALSLPACLPTYIRTWTGRSGRRWLNKKYVRTAHGSLCLPSLLGPTRILNPKPCAARLSGAAGGRKCLRRPRQSEVSRAVHPLHCLAPWSVPVLLPSLALPLPDPLPDGFKPGRQA